MVKEIGQHNSNISQYNSNISQFSNSNCSIMKIGSDDAKSSEITDENDLNGAIKKSKFLSSKKIPISHESIDLEPIKDIDYNTGDSQKNNKRNLLSQLQSHGISLDNKTKIAKKTTTRTRNSLSKNFVL